MFDEVKTYKIIVSNFLGHPVLGGASSLDDSFQFSWQRDRGRSMPSQHQFFL